VSRENVETAERAFNAFNRRDIDEFFEVATPDLEWIPALTATFEGGSIRGRDGMEAFMRDIPKTWEAFHSYAEEFRDLGDAVLVLGRAEARGRGSGAFVNAPMGVLLDFRGSRISRARAFLNRDEALKAVGLEE
jgi:ketosteroid isomerase-like protein